MGMDKSIWLIRHAENSKDEAVNFALTEDGRGKTALIAREIANIDHASPVLILASGMIRATQTAGILKEEFLKAAKDTLVLTCNVIATDNPEELAELCMVISDIDQICEKASFSSPQSIVIIGHKRNELLSIFNVILDPDAFVAGKPVSDEDRLPKQDYLNLIEAEESAIENLLGLQGREMPQHNYLDALHFNYRFLQWSEFDLGCANFQRKLEIF